MKARRLAWVLAVGLVVGGFVLALRAVPLSGGTLAGMLLVCAGFWWLIGLTAPRTQITLGEACDLMDEQRRRAVGR